MQELDNFDGGLPRPFSIDVRPDRQRVVVAPRGELDLATRDELIAQVRELTAAGFREIVLDLCHTEFIDSSGLAAVVGLDDAARDDGFALAILKGPAVVQRAFDISGLTPRLPFITAADLRAPSTD